MIPITTTQEITTILTAIDAMATTIIPIRTTTVTYATAITATMTNRKDS
jgi:hypothetical protein